MPARLAALALAASLLPAPALAGWFVDFETGIACQGYNDVRIPGDTGTEISLMDVLGDGPFAAGRAYLTWDVSRRGSLRLLVAPLGIEGDGTLADSVDFAGETFAPGPVDAAYKFNSFSFPAAHHQPN